MHVLVIDYHSQRDKVLKFNGMHPKQTLLSIRTVFFCIFLAVEFSKLSLSRIKIIEVTILASIRFSLYQKYTNNKN